MFWLIMPSLLSSLYLTHITTNPNATSMIAFKECHRVVGMPRKHWRFAVADTVNILKTVAATARMFGMALTMMTTMKKLRVKSVIRLTKQT
jgi:hypothetical protein